MKKIVLVAIMAIVSLALRAQIKDPVSWKYEAVKKTAGTYEVVVTATIEKPWHLYSQNTGKGGPIPTNFTFKANPLISLTGTPQETGKLEKTFDKNFNTNVLYYNGTVTFVQILKVKGSVKTNIAGTVEYMVCDDEQCLPPVKKSFDIKLQ